MKKILILMICFLFISKVAQAQEITPLKENLSMSASLTKNIYARNYILGPNDVFSITVYDSPEFDQKSIRVQPNGTIYIAPIGMLNVSGMSIEELGEVLTQKYRYYLNAPQVTINLEKTKPFIVYVSGAVYNPGGYEINTDTSQTFSSTYNPNTFIDRKAPLLSNILIASGGITFDADLEHVKVTNSYENSEFEINLLKLIENGDSNQDIYLMTGDSVYIPKLPTYYAVDETKYKKIMKSTIAQKEIPIRVFGYVNSPGLVKLNPAFSMRLNSAIAQAGGYTGNTPYVPNYVLVSRIDDNGKLITKKINPANNDITLYPHDIIYVPDKTKPIVGRAFDYTARLINPVNVFAQTYNNWALIFKPARYSVTGK